LKPLSLLATGLDLFSHTAEAEEGAFAERRPPDFSPYR
jgi:1,4-dihydroxy-2-naphthoyl-CoA synthase